MIRRSMMSTTSERPAPGAERPELLYAFAMAGRRRIPRLIANPLTTVLVAAALVVDLANLPGDPWSRVRSTAGVWYGSLARRYLPSQPPPARVDAIVFKNAWGLQLRDMGKEPSWGDVATIMSDKPADAALFDGPEGFWRGHGWWAITTMTQEFRIDQQFGSAFNAFDKQEARELYINEIVMPEWSESPRDLERLRRVDFTLTERVWTGYAHNAAALAGFVLLLVSLAWVPRVPGFLRERRAAARLRKGLCPRCSYPIGGLVVCPECGSAVVAG